MCANLRLVVSEVSRYANKGLPIEDLVSEGNRGLMRAAGKFDPDMGFRFSTYAVHHIRSAATRALSQQGQLVRVPVHKCELRGKVARAAAELYQELERDATDAEIANRAEMKLSDVETVRSMSGRIVSLDAPVGDEDSNITLQETIEDPFAEKPEEHAHQSEERTTLHTAIRQWLTDREASVVRLSFGLDGSPSFTKAEIADRLKISRTRVTALECIAIRKLRRALGANVVLPQFAG